MAMFLPNQLGGQRQQGTNTNLERILKSILLAQSGGDLGSVLGAFGGSDEDKGEGPGGLSSILEIIGGAGGGAQAGSAFGPYGSIIGAVLGGLFNR